MKKNIIFIIIVLLLLTSCSKKDNTEKIVVITDNDQEFINGLKLRNKKGKEKKKLIIKITKNDISDVFETYQKTKKMSNTFIINKNIELTTKLSTFLKNDSKRTIVINNSEYIIKNNPSFLNFTLSETDKAKAISSFILNNLKSKSLVFVVDRNDDKSINESKYLKEELYKFSPKLKTKTIFINNLKEISKTKHDIIVLLVNKELKENIAKIKKYSSKEIITTYDGVDSLKEFNYTLFFLSNFNKETNDALIIEFFDEYKKEYKKEPTQLSAIGYASYDYLVNYKDIYNGILGRITKDSKTVYIMKRQGDNMKLVEKINP